MGRYHSNSNPDWYMPIPRRAPRLFSLISGGSTPDSSKPMVMMNIGGAMTLRHRLFAPYSGSR